MCRMTHLPPSDISAASKPLRFSASFQFQRTTNNVSYADFSWFPSGMQTFGDALGIGVELYNAEIALRKPCTRARLCPRRFFDTAFAYAGLGAYQRPHPRESLYISPYLPILSTQEGHCRLHWGVGVLGTWGGTPGTLRQRHGLLIDSMASSESDSRPLRFRHRGFLTEISDRREP